MRYIRETLYTDLVTHGMEERMAESAKEIALNYLQFWLDASGASHQIPDLTHHCAFF